MPAKEAAKHGVTLREPYRPRPVHFLELWEVSGWRLKLYGLSYEHEKPEPNLLAAAKEVIQQHLPSPRADGAYGVGYVGVNQGRDRNYVFMDWWANETELHHYLYISSDQAPLKLEDATGTGILASVWGLQLIWFERNAWLEKVLTNPRGPDVEAYLIRRLADQA